MRVLLLLLTMATPAAAFEVEPWTPVPDGLVAAQPNLSPHPDGGLLVSWVERLPEAGHRLRYRHCATASNCSDPVEIARGTDWFVNWADFPSLVATPDGHLWAHLLRKNDSATYAYDAVFTHSSDAGAHWSALTPLHDDDSASEHGFASLLAIGEDRLLAAWLDGRNTLPVAGGARGAMSLRAAQFDAGGKRREWILDTSTCDCCQTDAAMSARGALLVWRDRDRDELRDIQIARLHDGRWSEPRYVHRDRWHVAACPVNGPTIAADGEHVWVAWYTEADGAPSLRLAVSTDAGEHFAAAREIAGADSIGRADLAFAGAALWLSWLRETEGEQSLWLARFDRDGRELTRQQLVTLSGRGRATGVPRLWADTHSALLLWTEVADGQSRVRGALVRP